MISFYLYDFAEWVFILLNAALPVAAFLFGRWHWGHSAKRKRREDIQREQLEKVLLPLDRFFRTHAEMDFDALAAVTDDLMDKHSLIVPSELGSVLDYIRNAQEPLDGEDWELARTASSTHYHWVKRQLGYPYSSAGIDASLLPPGAQYRAILWPVFRVLLAVGVMLPLLLLAFIVDLPEVFVLYLALLGIAVACAVKG